MAFPAKALEQLTHVTIRTPGWSSQLLMITGTVFFISLAFYLGITYGYLPYLNDQLVQTNDEIQAFSQQIPLSEQEKIVEFYSQLVNLKTLLSNHIHASPVYSWLEQRTLKGVAYSKFNLRSESEELTLSAYAKTAEEAAKQIRVFELEPQIKTVNLSSLTLGSTGLWQFEVRITFGERFLEEIITLPLPSESEGETTEEQP